MQTTGVQCDDIAALLSDPFIDSWTRAKTHCH